MSLRPRELTAATAAPLFAALGDATRLALLARLCNGHPQSITELTRGTGLSRQGVSKHLTILEQARVITSERVGRESRFKVRARALQDAGRYLDRASQQWDAAIDRLKSLVEDT
ncbi:MAG: metalloregulator ArsR/SmtB family transcription factor [Hyphomicrobiaceae bacterium]